MTEKYNAGEHVKIVRTDSLYENELGDQTGLVGTVKEGRNNGVYVTFPHTADVQFYYTNEEVEPVGKKATPAPEPLFRKGDHVRFLAGYNEDWTGTEFTIREDCYAENSGNPWASRLAKVTITKPSARLRSYSTDTQIGAHKLEKFTPAPFKVGDWVKVVGYGHGWDGTVAKITAVNDSFLTMVNDEHTMGVGFAEKYLELTEEPTPAPKYKVGDWVQVGGYGSLYDDAVGQVTMGGTTAPYIYVIKLHEHKHKTGGFAEKYLTPAEEPFKAAHKVGDWVKVTGWGSTYEGTVYQIKAVPVSKTDYYRFENAPGVGFSDQFLEATEAPYKAKFKVGDWVEVDYAGDWRGKVGQVTKVPLNKGEYTRVTYGTSTERTGSFFESELTLAEEPKPEPKFKAGDWVKVVGRGDGCDGIVGTITKHDWRTFWLVQRDDKSGVDHTYTFAEDKLELTEKPEEPHWTEAKPVGSVAQARYSNSKLDRILVKLSDTEWQHIYQSGDGSGVGATAPRSLENTKRLMQNRKLEWVS